MRLIFLSSDVRLTKRFSASQTGVERQNYPNVLNFTSHDVQVNNMAEFAQQLSFHAAQGHCLLKGTISQPLVNQSRKGSTNSDEMMDWVCLDIDGMTGTPTSVLKAIGLDDITYVIQYSASYGITSKDLRCHIFMQLAHPVSAPQLKQWLISLNLETNSVRSQISLTKSKNSLSWPIDVTACQADKLLYIAPPALVGIKDPLRPTDRIKLIKGKTDKLTIGAITLLSTNDQGKAKLIRALRDIAGYPVMRQSIKQVNGQALMSNPDVGTVTGIKTDRGFTYLNINGGDSWGYYHPANNPDYIYNFKDEPNYVTKDFLPEYWNSLVAPVHSVGISTGLRYLAFLDRRSSTYYRGTYDPATEHLDLYSAKNETQVRHFAKAHGQPLGDFIPEWDIVFDPDDNVRVDFDRRVINTFEPTQFMRTKPVQRATPPPGILRVIHHALGDDERITRHFIHWLAYVLQKRDRSLTAWVLHGTTGTGKGILFHRVLVPLFGAKQVAMKRMEEFDTPFNAYIENNLLLCVDEMEASALFNAKGVMAKLKNFITEETVSLRALYRNAYDVPNRSNWLFFSNQPEVVHIPLNDRRFNVGVYQAKKLDMTQLEIDALAGELQEFYDFLHFYPVDRQVVQTPIETDARASMIAISESSIDSVCNAVRNGDFEFLMDHLPTGDDYKLNPLELNKVEAYTNVLKKLISRSDSSGSCSVLRDELRTILEYCVGHMPTSPNKFTSLIKHHRIHMGVVHNPDIQKQARGIKVIWQKPAEFPEYMSALVPPKPSLKAVK